MKTSRTLNSAVACLLYLLCAASLFSPTAAFCQQNGEQKNTAAAPTITIESQRDEIARKIKAINEKIAAAKGMENAQTANRFQTSLDALKLRTSLLRETETIYQRQLAALTKQESLQKELALLIESSKQGKDKTIPEKPPYSLDVYDYYLDQLSNSLRQVEVATQSIAVDSKSLQEANERLNEAEKKLRALADANNKSEPSFGWRKLAAEDEQELARALVDLQRIINDNNHLALKLAELKKNINQQNIDWLKENLTFKEDQLAKHLAVIEERRKELEQRIDKLLREQYIAENKWLAAQQQTDPSQAASEKKLAVDNAYLQAREAWRETYQHVISHSNSMLQLLNREAQLWQRRYALLKDDIPDADLKTWRKEAKAEVTELSRALSLQQAHQNNVQARIAATRTQLSKEKINPEVVQHLETTMQALNKLGERNFEYLTVLQGAIELNQRLAAAIDEKLQEFNFGEKLAMIGSRLTSVWQYELFVIDTHAVTVGKIIIAFILFITGIILSGFFTRLINRRLLIRLNLSLSARAITEKLIYYTSILVVTYIALRSVNIPMTAFTFLGGAVAIGVGFGAQKLINNFISGFILMVEQPIKVGDLVQLGDYLGKIEDIGVRSTRVLTFDNVDFLVPNSYFLENNITNWTHNDNMVRGRITVGVIYGSPTKLVKKQLLEAAGLHGEVLKKPEPYVLFDDFGDNSLVFTLFFWLIVERVLDKKRIESDIRFIIDKLFRESNLVIAFPQRDVHLDTSKALQISITKAEAPKKQEEKNSS